jgi:N-methylhydantoinase A
LRKKSILSGKQVKMPKVDEVIVAIRRLLERGARVTVVSLRRAVINNANEMAVKDIIDTDYPKHYLGAVPVLLSTEVGSVRDDALRTNNAVINTYLYRDMQRFSFKADDDLGRLAVIGC